MPKCPRSSGPVRNELGCWMVMRLRSYLLFERDLIRKPVPTFRDHALSFERDLIRKPVPTFRDPARVCRSGARGADEGADPVRILLARGTLDPGGDVDRRRPRDRQRLAHIGRVEAA